MKWLSHDMSGNYRHMISAAAIILIFAGLIAGNERGNTSMSAFFFALIILFSGLIFWNIFDNNNLQRKLYSSSPGVKMPTKIDQINQTTNSMDESIEVNPMDYDIEIPLM